MEPVKRKPYQSPKITKVVLRREQAILSACYTGTTSASTSNAAKLCKSTGTVCRRASSGAASNPS
jgi:hypothetical protein